MNTITKGKTAALPGDSCCMSIPVVPPRSFVVTWQGTRKDSWMDEQKD
jgi:hypothetical protein